MLVQNSLGNVARATSGKHRGTRFGRVDGVLIAQLDWVSVFAGSSLSNYFIDDSRNTDQNGWLIKMETGWRLMVFASPCVSLLNTKVNSITPLTIHSLALRRVYLKDKKRRATVICES
jgi:hypothetical protein